MDNVTIERKIALNLNAEDWALYTAAFSETELNVVSRRINAEVCLILNNHPDRDQAWKLCKNVMSTYGNYGASDTEPRGVLTDIFNLFYSED